MNQVKELLQYIFDAVKICVIIQPWQQGLRVRFGKNQTLLTKGVCFKIPYFDSVYVQEVRLRICDMPMQTVTTKDAKTITLSGSVGYSISDIQKLYNTMYHPETSIRNMAMSEISKYIFTQNISDVNIDSIGENVISGLNKSDYGIKFEYFQLTTFAIVRTYRLIQDQNWGGEALNMTSKK